MGRRKSKVLKKRKVSVNNADKRPYNKEGRAGFLPGNPGRPEGSVNKYTRIKEQLAEVFEEIDGKQMTKDFAQTGNRNFARFLDHIVALATRQNHEGNRPSIINIVYGYRANSTNRSVRSGSRNKADKPS